MSQSERSITVATDNTLTSLIDSAMRRVVIVAPALSLRVAQAVAQKWKLLGRGAVTVILDLHPEVFRLGYGDFEAFTHLQAIAKELGAALQCQSGIRIGLLIADESMLVFSPTPLLIEGGPKRLDAPNAILIGEVPSAASRELGLRPGNPDEAWVGRDRPIQDLVENVRRNLEENPPQKFDVARTIRAFNAHFEFVEFELVGTAIGRKTIPIPSELMGLAGDEKTQKLLKASFRVTDPEDDVSGGQLEHDKSLLVRAFLKNIPHYGNVILRTRKVEFEAEAEKLKKAVEEFAKGVKSALQASMDKKRAALMDAIWPTVKSHPPKKWLKSDLSSPSEKVLRQFLDEELKQAFGTADKLVGQMQVRLVFKGVTYESLKDDKFLEAAEKVIPGLRHLIEEFDVAKGVSR